MNRTYLMIGGAGLATTLAAAIAIAHPPPPSAPPRPPAPKTRVELQAMIAQHFKAADTNNDGVVTKAELDAARDKMREKMRAEFEAKRVARRAEIFAMLDKDKNGSLSKQEFTAAPPRPEDGRDMPPPPGGPEGGPGKDGPGRNGPGRDSPGGPGKFGHGGPDGPDGHRMGWRHDGPGPMRGPGIEEGLGFGDRWFDRADANHDGKLTLAEASAGPLARFDLLDTNKDGTISDVERDAFRSVVRGMNRGDRDHDDRRGSRGDDR
jgi:hypothetical protein